MRLLRRPSTRSVLVGDVVAFHSPLAQPDDDTHVMVRLVGVGVANAVHDAGMMHMRQV